MQIFRLLPTWRITRVSRFALPILTVLSASCSSILDTTEEYADNAIIEVTGSSAVPLLLVSSTNWNYIISQETGAVTVSLTTADTVSLSLPINRSVAIDDRYRIFFQLINPDSVQTASIRMRVRLDDQLVFDQAANMRDASLEFRFAYGRPLGQ